MVQPTDAAAALKFVPAVKVAPNTIKSVINMPAIRVKFTEMLGEKKAAGFLSSVISTYEGSKALRECNPMNIVAQAAVAASLDLPIVNGLGFAALVPYGGVCQFRIMAKGFIQLAIRTGEYADMNSSEVYEDELELYNPITGQIRFTLQGKWKQRDAGEAGKIVGYVAFFQLLNGFHKYLYMTNSQLMAHAKKYSKSFQKGKGKWADDPHVMKLKTVTKLLLSKWGILSVELMRAIRVDQGVVTELPGEEDKVEYPDLPDANEQPEAPPKAEDANKEGGSKTQEQGDTIGKPLIVAGKEDSPRGITGSTIKF